MQCYEIYNYECSDYSFQRSVQFFLSVIIIIIIIIIIIMIIIFHDN